MKDDFKILKTDDGSETLFSQEFNETMHSNSGAYEEAVKKHLIPSKILERNGEIFVIDLGFGIGYNSLALIENIIYRGDVFCHIDAFEKDKNILKYLDKIDFTGLRREIFADIKQAYLNGFVKNKNYSINLFFGDARDSISNLEENRYHAIFQDAFSPGKNPELWSVDFFKVVFDKLQEDAMLTTYSSALQIRRSLYDAGFYLGKGPSVGQKREGTIASKKWFEGAFYQKELTDFFSNPKSIPYRDESFLLTRQEILGNRTKEIKEIKLN